MTPIGRMGRLWKKGEKLRVVLATPLETAMVSVHNAWLIDNAKNVQCDDDVSVTQHHLTSCLRHSIIDEIGRALGDAT